MRDVIVVGAGPAGSAAAKRCAEYGLDTILLEKRGLPRDKVCGGMVMGPLAHTLIKQEFGDIPGTFLSKPPSLSGYIIHVPGTGSRQIDNFTALAWRRDLDYWMNQQAQAKGAEIWPGARVTGLRQKEPGLIVELDRDNKREELEARFVIGADGTGSLVRRLLFPELKISYRQVYWVVYRGELELDKSYYHWFYPGEYSPSLISVHQKDGFTIVSVSSELGQAKRFMDWTKKFLAETYRLDTSQPPVRQDGCVGLKLYKELIAHTFLPARGNALLAGDAASFHLPVSGEGIGTAIQSGLLAADAILRAAESGAPADRLYLARLEPIISALGKLDPWLERITKETRSGGDSLLEVLREAYHSTLRIF